MAIVKKKNTQTINAGEGVKKGEPFYTVGGNVNWYSHYGEQYGYSFKKLRINLPNDPSTLLLGIYPEKTTILKDTCTPMFIAALFTIARTRKQCICPSTNECKEVVVSNGILLNHKKNKFESVVRWMKLKPVTQNEISQEEKNKYSILIHTHRYEI